MARCTVGADGQRAPVELYYEVHGTGPRLLVISGTGGDLRAVPRLDGPLGAHFEVAAYDQRGQGQSSAPPGPWSMADYAADAAGLLGALGWDGAFVLGISFGGMVAQELAVSRPSMVRRLVLACTSAGGAGGSSFPLETLEDLAPDERIERITELLDTRHDAAWREANPAQWARLADLARSAAASRLAPPAGDRGPSPTALQLEARAGHDTFERLGRISCPTLVVGGRTDGIAPPANARRLAGAIAGSELRLFDGGHLFLAQDPAAYPAVIEFLIAGPRTRREREAP